jgi:hypothetical protein
MIRALAHANGLVLAAELQVGEVAYLDADWVRTGDAPLPALVADGNGSLRFGERSLALDGREPNTAAAAALEALAQDAAEKAVQAGGPVDVVGNGVVAARLRELLPARGGDDRADICVDTTGDETVIGDATRRLADLGALVLVGEPGDEPVSFDLYPDVHVRGLRLIGVAGPLAKDLPATEPPSLFADTLVALRAGDGVPAGALWLRVERADNQPNG